MAKNEMKAMRGMPLRVRSMEGLAMGLHAERMFALGDKLNVRSRVLDSVLPARTVFNVDVNKVGRRIVVNHDSVELAELKFMGFTFLELQTALRQATTAVTAIGVHAAQ